MSSISSVTSASLVIRQSSIVRSEANTAPVAASTAPVQSIAPTKPCEPKEKDKLGGSLSDDTLAAILQLAQQVIGNQSNPSGGPSAEDLFSAIDADANGLVSKDEFVAARPQGASVEQALDVFSSIDTQGTGSINLSQFATHLQETGGPEGQGGAQQAGGPPPGGGPGGGGGGASTAETYDPLDTNEDGTVSLPEMVAGLDKETENQTTDIAGLLNELLKATQSYASSGIGGLQQSQISTSA